MTDLPNRKSIRLQNYDYTQEGMYFVTICAHERQMLFGKIVNEKMELNSVGKIIESVWKSLPNRFPVELDTFQTMPNHIHMIIDIVGAIHESPEPTRAHRDINRAHRDAPLQRRSLLSQIIGYLKMNSSKMIHQIDPNLSVWQRNYYEHIIRNETELNKIREYIQTNPQRWERDRNNIFPS